jgi:hypothetical protein
VESDEHGPFYCVRHKLSSTRENQWNANRTVLLQRQVSLCQAVHLFKCVSLDSEISVQRTGAERRLKNQFCAVEENSEHSVFVRRTAVAVPVTNKTRSKRTIPNPLIPNVLTNCSYACVHSD